MVDVDRDPFIMAVVPWFHHLLLLMLFCKPCRSSDSTFIYWLVLYIVSFQLSGCSLETSLLRSFFPIRYWTSKMYHAATLESILRPQQLPYVIRADQVSSPCPAQGFMAESDRSRRIYSRETVTHRMLLLLRFN